MGLLKWLASLWAACPNEWGPGSGPPRAVFP